MCGYPKMKFKIYTMKKNVLLFIGLFMFCLINAQLKHTEYFDAYGDGDDLEIIQTGTELSETDWYLTLKTANQIGSSPVIASGSLSYPGYIASEQGNTVVLSADDANNDRISTKRVLNEAITEDGLYAAFLINVESAKTTYNDFFTWEASTASSFVRGRLCVKSTAEGDMNFGICKTDLSSIVETSAAYDFNTTYLLVFKYEKVGSEDDGNDDVVRLFVNPDMTLTESENASIVSTDIVSLDYDSGNKAIAIDFRQNRVGVKISSIRISTTWNGLWSDTATGLLSAPKSEQPDMIVYENMFTNNELQSGELCVYNISGSLCLNKKIDAGETVSANLSKGVYIVKFIGEDRKLKVKKILIK